MKKAFRMNENAISLQLDSLKRMMQSSIGEEQFLSLRDMHHNERLTEFVLNWRTTSKIYETENRFIQKADPIFMKPGSRYGRAHFFAPYKQIGNLKIETLIFNIIAIWIMTIFLFITLFYDILKRFIVFLETLEIPIWRKFGRELLRL